MPNAESLAAISQMLLIQNVDTGRPASDVFKLTPFLRTQTDTDLAALDKADADTALTESDRAGSSATARAALDNLQDHLREGFKVIDAIRATKITDAERLEAFTSYGWAGGKLGRFNDARVLGLARLGVQDHSSLPTERRYPADLVADLKAQLAIFDGNADAATGGERETATKQRNDALDAANTTLAQVRFYYCSASRDTDQTSELTRIGFQTRRDAGAAPQPAQPPPPAPPAKP